jgi:tRNA nucleotidyltransferase (CCA-adding enzyme)
MLMHDLGKPRAKTTDEAGIDHFHQHEDYSEGIAKEVLRRLKFDNDTIYKVCKMVKYHDYGKGIIPDAKIVRRAVNKIGEDIFPLLFEVRKADILAQSETYREEKLHLLALWEEGYAEILAKKECVSLKQLAVTGADLIQVGILPGKEMGRILNGLLEMVLEDPGLNTKEKLLAEVEKYK